MLSVNIARKQRINRQSLLHRKKRITKANSEVRVQEIERVLKRISSQGYFNRVKQQEI
jgi:hypothetical protein